MIKTKVEFDEYEGASGAWKVSTSKDGVGWNTLAVSFPHKEDAQDVANLIGALAR